MEYILIGLGGFFGANCRYLVGGWVNERLGAGFPYGTLLVNVSGSFIIGLFLAFLTERADAPTALRLFFAVGFLGAYTTFSTFSHESLTLLAARDYLGASANMVSNLALGLLAVFLGFFAGRSM